MKIGQEKLFPGGENSQCKGPGVGSLRKGKETWAPAAKGTKERMWEVRPMMQPETTSCSAIQTM